MELIYRYLHCSQISAIHVKLSQVRRFHFPGYATTSVIDSTSSPFQHIFSLEIACQLAIWGVGYFAIALKYSRRLRSTSSHYSDVIMNAMASLIIRRLDCLLKLLFRRRSKKISKPRVTGLCEGNWLVNSPQKGPVTRKIRHIWERLKNTEPTPDWYFRESGSLLLI